MKNACEQWYSQLVLNCDSCLESCFVKVKSRLENCTPHPIIFFDEDTGREFTFKPSGILPRVSTVETPAEDICESLPAVKQATGEIIGLPQEKAGNFLIVSSLVFNASDRKDLIAPDTGKAAIRDEKGRILGVTRFLRK